MELRKRSRLPKAVSQVLDATEPIRSFDLYPKLKEDHKRVEKTAWGAGVTIASALVVFVLTCSEVSSYLTTTHVEQMTVDPTLGQRLDIYFDITFHALHCGEVNLDAMDVAGEQQNGVAQDIIKTRLSPEGLPIGTGVRVKSDKLVNPKSPDYCGACYGAESDTYKCCNTCEELIKAYEHKGWNTAGLGSTEQCKDTNMGQPGEGCNIAGHLDVNKVAGNFHVAMGQTHTRDSRHIHQFNPSQIPKFNVSHTIKYMRFGEELAGYDNPLDGHEGKVDVSTGVFQYYLKLVPVQVKTKSWAFLTRWRQSSLYSVNHAFRPAFVNGVQQSVLPGVFFVYDFSPFMMTRETKSVPLFEFLTGLFAILGGVITVAGMVYSIGYHVSKSKHPLLSPKTASKLSAE